MNPSQVFSPDKDNEFSNKENKSNLPSTISIHTHHSCIGMKEKISSQDQRFLK